jgi:hypothetical protein
MRILMAIAFGCALMIGANHAASSGSSARGEQPPTQRATSADGYSTDGLDDASTYVCQLSPICQHASQCTAYCAGGTPVCFQGCCSCAS